MATIAARPPVVTPPPDRRDISALVGITPKLQRGLESLFRDVNGTLPDAAEQSNQAVIDAQEAAKAAQVTANTAIADAAAAQSTANIANAAAIAAQADATTAIANAATAQSTANSALANAATAQGTANLALSNAATAQGDANTLKLPPYVEIAVAGITPNARALTAGAGISINDGGAGNPVTISSNVVITNVVLPADVSTTAVTLSNVTGMTFPVAANSFYELSGVLTFRSASTAVGIGLAVSMPAASLAIGEFTHPATTITKQGGYFNAPGTLISATNTLPFANSDTPISFRAHLITGANAGNAQLQFSSAIAGTQVTLRGVLSFLSLRKVG